MDFLRADFPEFFAAFVGLGLLVAVGELLHRRVGLRTADTRRIVHLGTGLAVASFPYFFDHSAAVYLLAVVFLIINGAAALTNTFSGLHGTDRITRGTVTFPLALLVVLPITWQADRIFALQTAFLLLAVCDPLASWAGEYSDSSYTFRDRSRKKSLWGSVAFFGTALSLTLGAAFLLGTWPARPDYRTLLMVAVALAFVATAIEFLGGKGWDNLFIVVGVVVLLVVWQTHQEWTAVLLVGTLAGVVFGGIAWWLNFLTLSGAVAGGLFAATLVGFGGWSWVLPGFAFFFLSSALSRIASADPSTSAGTGRDRGPRLEGQVYANGGIAWGMLVAYALYPSTYFYWGFLGAISAAAADTWASEIGPMVDARPRMILSGREVPAGTSGAVSWTGTLVGVVGSLVVGLAGFVTKGEGMITLGLEGSLMIVVVSGIVGSLVDSLAGSTVQAVYELPSSGRIIEAPERVDASATLVRGWRWFDNQRVNWLATASGALVGMFLWGLG